MDDVMIPPTRDVDAELRLLVHRYRGASRGGIEVMNALGGHAESWISRLPEPIRAGLDGATQAALKRAVKAAQSSRTHVGDQAPWVNSALGAVMGAAGGFGGAGTALAELPITTTLLLRVIHGVAAEHGFDPSEESVQFDSLTVFSSAGPLSRDDGAETAFLSARMAMSGAALQKVLQTVAPKLAAAFGQKLAAQAVPVLGAAAGAVINHTYVRYYSEMAHIHFGLRRLAIDTGVSEQELTAAFRRLAEEA